MTTQTSSTSPRSVRDPARPEHRLRRSRTVGQTHDPRDLRPLLNDMSPPQALASWFAPELASLRHQHRRSAYGLAIANLWRSWERSGRIKDDPYGCQLDHARAVQQHIFRAQHPNIWHEPTDLDRYAFPWYARLSIGVVRFLELAIVPALFVVLLVMIYR